VGRQSCRTSSLSPQFCPLTNARAAIIDYLQNTTANSFTVIYFFCDHRDPGKQSLQDLAHVLTKQLLDRDIACFKEAKLWREERLPGSKTLAKPLNILEYIEIIQRLCSRWESVSLIVDAVDECTGLDDFIRGLESLIANSNIKLLLTSRHDIELIRAIYKIAGYKLAMTEYMEHDIETYLNFEVKNRIALGSLKLKQQSLMECESLYRLYIQV
jgi:hypothetical protein